MIFISDLYHFPLRKLYLPVYESTRMWDIKIYNYCMASRNSVVRFTDIFSCKKSFSSLCVSNNSVCNAGCCHNRRFIIQLLGWFKSYLVFAVLQNLPLSLQECAKQLMPPKNLIQLNHPTLKAPCWITSCQTTTPGFDRGIIALKRYSWTCRFTLNQ